MEKASDISRLKDEILHLAALSGEISPFALSRLDRSPKYIQNCLYDLMQDNMLIYCSKDDLEGYRLKPQGKHYLARTYFNRFADFFTVGNKANKVRLDLIHRRRNLHSSEVITMMYKNGAAIFPDDKPKLYAPLADSSQSSQSSYYTSYEVKDIGEDGIKINNTRFNGLLRCHAGDFLLRMNFLSDSMKRLKYSVLQKMNLQPCPNSLDCDGYADDRTAVLFACDMDLKRIRNLKAGAEPKSLNLIIICFDFQAELLSRYYGNLATIRTIDTRKTAELFKIPYGGGAS